MTSSVFHIRRDKATNNALVGMVVGKYFDPDYNIISENIEQAMKVANKLWQLGFLVFCPHLNTHHFEAKTRLDPDKRVNEEYFRAFDRKVMKRRVDFIRTVGNWRKSGGGRLEVQLANHLGIPVFESDEELVAWSDGEQLYSNVTYKHISEEALQFGTGVDLPIALVDGPFWRQDGAEFDMAAIKHYEREAERVSVQLFNSRIAAFTPHLNSSYAKLEYAVPLESYQLLCEEVIKSVADCHVLVPGWETDPHTRERIALATALGKPSFSSINEALRWKNGSTDYSAVSIGPPKTP